MTFSQRLPLILLFLFLSLCVSYGDDYLEVTAPADRRPRLAVAPPVSLALSSSPERAKELAELMKFDLNMAGNFQLLATPSNEGHEGIRPGEFDFATWQGTGAQLLVKSGFKQNGNTLTLECRLYDLQQREVLAATLFTGKSDDLRRLGHACSDEILRAATGERGFFSGSIAFVSARGSAKELFLMDWDGRALQPLTSNGSLNLRPDPSPDGRQILYLSYKGGHPALYRRDLYSGSESRLFADNGVTGGRWSPDGSKIAVSHSRDGNDEIYLMARDGKELARLTRSPAIDISPTFSPDGRQVAFVSDRLGSPQIFIMNIDGSEVRRLTIEGGYNVSPHWSPKGDRIVYSRQESKGFQIHIVNIDGSNDLRLTESGRNEHPRWSPDGRLIIFTSTRDHTPAIYVMRTDGAAQSRISPGSTRDSHPVWLSPPRP